MGDCLKKLVKKKKIAFSVAEAMMALLISSVALGAAAPLITKQIKTANNNVVDPFPNHSIMFFNLNRCPDGWVPVNPEFIGHYPRIIGEGEGGHGGRLNTTLEQMVHKHKHVSPFLAAMNGSGYVNSFRYGPYSNLNSRTAGKDVFENEAAVRGDNDYPELEAAKETVKLDKENESVTVTGETDYNVTANSTLLMRGWGASGMDFNNWYLYTSDGMNRNETLSVGSYIQSFPVCPNKPNVEDDVNCTDDYSYIAMVNNARRQIVVKNPPTMDDMVVVGDENRPNSVQWLACERVRN